LSSWKENINTIIKKETSGDIADQNVNVNYENEPSLNLPTDTAPNETIADADIDVKIQRSIINNAWNDDIEKTVASYGENSNSYKWMHDKSSESYRGIDSYITIGLIFLSTVLSALTFFTSDTNLALNIFTRIITYLINFLTVMNQTLKFKDVASKHSIAANEFSLLYHNIQQQLCLFRRDRVNAIKYMQKILSQYDSLQTTGPDIPARIIKQFMKTFRNSNFSIPDIADRIQKIDIITEDNTVSPTVIRNVINNNDNLPTHSNINTNINPIVNSRNNNNVPINQTVPLQILGNNKSDIANFPKIINKFDNGEISDKELKGLSKEKLLELTKQATKARIEFENSRSNNFR
jgi:hypothetical protein